MTLVTDLELARSVEGFSARVMAQLVQTLARRNPAGGATFLALGRVVAPFAGTGSPLNEVIGLGLDGPVEEKTLLAIEAFYQARQTAVRIQLCPLAEESLGRRLTARGYALLEFENVLVRELSPADATAAPSAPGVSVDPAKALEQELWCRLARGGFFAPAAAPDAFEGVFEALFEQPDTFPWIARVDGEPAGAASVGVQDGITNLFGMATLPAYRGRGVQSALIAARLAVGARLGSRIATVGGRPGSGSQRNLERAGFHIAYTRPLLVLDTRGHAGERG